MVCPRCFEELGIKTQMKIEGGFMRCILCRHKELKGNDDGTTKKIRPA